jgi:hypothetical protein
MKSSLFSLSVLTIFVAVSELRAAEPPAAGAGPLETKVLNIKFPDRAGAVIWAAHNDFCLIQITFPTGREGGKEAPATQVWLLKADGTIIPPKEKPFTFSDAPANRASVATSYVFPASAKAEGVAAVVSVGSDFFVERLLPKAK